MEIDEIKKVLKEFQRGYTERDIKKSDGFLRRLFIINDESYILGTSTSELDFGYDEMKELFDGDWEYWGNVSLDYENAQVNVYGSTAFIGIRGYVEIPFKFDKTNGYSLESVVECIKNTNLSSKQKTAFINWLLTVDHLRSGQEESSIKYPLRLSGVMINKEGWHFVQLHFSIPRGDYPDERFEHDLEYIENYNAQMTKLEKCYCGVMNDEIKRPLMGLANNLIGNDSLKEEEAAKYFNLNDKSYVIAPDNNLYIGKKMIYDGFKKTTGMKLSLDYSKAIVRNNDDTSWVTIFGTVKSAEGEKKFFDKAIRDIEKVTLQNLSPEEKLSKIHRKSACALREASSGSEKTYPVRITAAIVHGRQGMCFDSLHISYPYYWILNNKLDSL